MAKKKSRIAKVVETVEGWVGMKPVKKAKRKPAAKKTTNKKTAKKKAAKKKR